MQIVTRFDPEHAQSAHENTILAAPVLPEGMPAPFGHAWGYLAGRGEMDRHSHPTEELYLFTGGNGYLELDGVRYAVAPGDVTRVPPNAVHTVINEKNAPLQWAAFWWDAQA